MKNKIIINLVVYVAYIFFPSFICIKILKSNELISCIGEGGSIVSRLLAVIIILSYLLIEFTANNSNRFIVIILSALGASSIIITLNSNNHDVMSFVFTGLLLPLLLIYFICFLMVFSLYMRKKSTPGNKEETVK
ncbi:MAG: hypothetical protein ACYC4Q_07155 [Victivallaceae bacterium]